MRNRSSADLLEELRQNELVRRAILNERRRAVDLEPVPVVESAGFAEAAEPPQRARATSRGDTSRWATFDRALEAMRAAVIEIAFERESIPAEGEIDDRGRQAEAERAAHVSDARTHDVEDHQHA
jgi:hypothetical protein